jgi:prefoldin subunit 5
MRDQIEARLRELHAELEAGQRQLAALESQEQQLRELLLRISGAAQVLEELLAAEPAENGAVTAAA